MSSHSTKTLTDPRLQTKMPLFDVSSKLETLPTFMGKQYGGNYYAYDTRGKDGAGLTPSWNLHDRSPVSHLTSIEEQKRMIFRQDRTSSGETRSRPSSGSHTPVKKGFVLYTKSPEVCAPTVGAAPNQKEDRLPSPSRKHVYLAVPKPVYGHSPCCADLSYVMGQRYSVDHVSSWMPNAVYEQDWVQTTPVAYGEKTPAHRREVLLQHRGFPLERAAELKQMPVEAFLSSRTRTLPSVIEPRYSGYPCTSDRALFPALKEHNRPPQVAPGSYPNIYTSTAAYEHTTSDVYQQHSPMPKYGQLAQGPMFYYPRPNVVLENGTRCKENGSKQDDHAPVLHRHSIPNLLHQYAVPHGEVPFAYTDMSPGHHFMRGFDFPYYAVPQVPLNPAQTRTPVDRQRSSPLLVSNHMSVSPPVAGHPEAKDKPTTSLQGDQRRTQAVRFFHPLTSLHTAAPIHVQARQPQVLPLLHSASPQTLESPSQSSGVTHTSAANVTNVQKIGNSLAARTESRQRRFVSVIETPASPKAQKRNISHSSPVLREEDRDLYEVAFTPKQPKVQKTDVKDGKTVFPPMPVIHNVFSLAPYQLQLQLQASEVILSEVPNRSIQVDVNLPISHSKEKSQNEKSPQPASEETNSSALTRVVVEELQPLQVKTEKAVSSDSDSPLEVCCNVKREAPECASLHSTSMSLNERFNNVRKNPPPLSESELKPHALSSKVKPPVDAKPITILQLSTDELVMAQDNKVNFKNIPPHYLKLSTYNIIVPDGKQRSVNHLAGEPLLRTENVLTPKLEVEPPVRKDFFELHHTLCKLIAKSVSVSPEEDLKTWRSRLEAADLAAPPGKVKVSFLMGVDVRETWIDEEMRSTLAEATDWLKEYTALERCPFPHVTRARAVFLPLLVVKELLFPVVQGNLINQVLREHKVELWPTTLSEEKILIQLHKRACSPGLWRLMPLKVLPDVYMDVVNLLYYTYVCKHLGVRLETTGQQGNAHKSSFDTPESPASISPTSPKEDPEEKDQKTKLLGSQRRRSRVKSRSRNAFLDSDSSDEDEGDDSETQEDEDPVEKRASESSERDSPPLPQHKSWMCPLSLDEGLVCPDGVTAETTADLLSHSPTSKLQLEANKCSGVILKLRKMLSAGGNQKKTRYQTVSPASASADAALTERGDQDLTRTTKLLHKWNRKGRFTHALRSLDGRSAPNHLLKIKYCPHLSACHSAESRRRWVLRSAVQRARGAMRLRYPDLVGKKIYHLYEEVDKSEVWYRGEVLRVHEANANPLKTVFEVRYDSEPEWKYYLELLVDYDKGWLKIEEGADSSEE